MSQTAHKSTETTFQVTIFHKCSLNSFSISDTLDQTYQIAATGLATAVTVPISSVSGNTAGCPLTYTIEILDNPSGTWTTIT
jgi:hypothetical protein